MCSGTRILHHPNYEKLRIQSTQQPKIHFWPVVHEWTLQVVTYNAIERRRDSVEVDLTLVVEDVGTAKVVEEEQHGEE